MNDGSMVPADEDGRLRLTLCEILKSLDVKDPKGSFQLTRATYTTYAGYILTTSDEVAKVLAPFLRDRARVTKYGPVWVLLPPDVDALLAHAWRLWG